MDRKEIKTAGDARQVALANLKGPVIQPWVEYILAVIAVRARGGRFNLVHPFQDRKGDVGRASPEYPTTEMQEALKEHFVGLNFKWTEHPDPDPGSPGSGPYIEITW